jgi:hypothetical protein
LPEKSTKLDQQEMLNDEYIDIAGGAGDTVEQGLGSVSQRSQSYRVATEETIFDGVFSGDNSTSDFELNEGIAQMDVEGTWVVRDVGGMMGSTRTRGMEGATFFRNTGISLSSRMCPGCARVRA